ncbi:unnamed protein product [Linum tenue]|uniref:Uncharacterized protein n=1 Tax=Linum tenue TaxID=586396 RepID=A0AAV0Q6T1_9ROSI|nr:unnamed protein product [Linum tenue]
MAPSQRHSQPLIAPRLRRLSNSFVFFFTSIILCPLPTSIIHILSNRSPIDCKVNPLSNLHCWVLSLTNLTIIR